MPARQTELFDKPPRRSRGQLMHVFDAGDADGLICEMKCSKCGYRSGWLHFSTITEAKRGLPCPQCNKEKEQ